MHRPQSPIMLSLLALFAFAGRSTAAVFACAGIGAEPVAVAEESAIIIWDETTKTQHFIRRASFKTNSRDFGFLVPTPTRPKLEEAGDEAFKYLEDIAVPRIATAMGGEGGGCGCGAKRGEANRVVVLEEKRVGGYAAAVLKAGDPADLEAWLKKHGYPFPQTLKDWVTPYLKNAWIITAFKIDKEKADDPKIATAAVRMTFTTERPFFPYREPKEDKAGDADKRLLRVYFLGKARMEWRLGDEPEKEKTKFADKLTAEQRAKVLEYLKLPDDTLPAEWWLTMFEDRSYPRPGDVEVYFGVAAEQAPLGGPRARAGSVCVMSLALLAYVIGLAARRSRFFAA